MKEKLGHTILLGGIGGDANSVGLSLLRQSLLMNHYKVHYMGTQSRLEDFIQGLYERWPLGIDQYHSAMGGCY
jgi:methanogenic corrinoid protein MtbC1